MPRRIIDPDLTCRDDGAYWAAALIIAVRAGDRSRTNLARQHLRRLGYSLEVADELRRRSPKGVRRDR